MYFGLQSLGPFVVGSHWAVGPFIWNIHSPKGFKKLVGSLKTNIYTKIIPLNLVCDINYIGSNDAVYSLNSAQDIPKSVSF